jgi:hypothetical protein
MLKKNYFIIIYSGFFIFLISFYIAKNLDIYVFIYTYILKIFRKNYFILLINILNFFYLYKNLDIYLNLNRWKKIKEMIEVGVIIV